MPLSASVKQLKGARVLRASHACPTLPSCWMIDFISITLLSQNTGIFYAKERK